LTTLNLGMEGDVPVGYASNLRLEIVGWRGKGRRWAGRSEADGKLEPYKQSGKEKGGDGLEVAGGKSKGTCASRGDRTQRTTGCHEWHGWHRGRERK